MTPDVYSAMVFSLLTDEYIYSNEALAINGASHHSGGTAGFETAKRKRAYDPAEKFWSEENIPFHKDLPLADTGWPVRSIHAFVYEAYLQAASFHSEKDNVVVSPRQQLAIIMKEAHPRHTEEVRNWGLSFAAQHKIDCDDISHRGNHGINWLMSNIFDAARSLGRLCSGLTFYGDRHIPLNNVYEASIVAGTIKSIKPGYIYRFINACSRLKRRIQLKSSVTPLKEFNGGDDAKQS